ncbi:MAG TPA: hypothetical protein VND54_01675 [Candidatus Saccharimonadales bacterium]|nr:hypothetical protein [Candidatus Saccharimonadales bacterium]
MATDPLSGTDPFVSGCIGALIIGFVIVGTRHGLSPERCSRNTR